MCSTSSVANSAQSSTVQEIQLKPDTKNADAVVSYIVKATDKKEVKGFALNSNTMKFITEEIDKCLSGISNAITACRIFSSRTTLDSSTATSNDMSLVIKLEGLPEESAEQLTNSATVESLGIIEAESSTLNEASTANNVSPAENKEDSNSKNDSIPQSIPADKNKGSDGIEPSQITNAMSSQDSDTITENVNNSENDSPTNKNTKKNYSEKYTEARKQLKEAKNPFAWIKAAVKCGYCYITLLLFGTKNKVSVPNKDQNPKEQNA